MYLDGTCFNEKLTFLKYINERALLYCITLLAFLGVFLLLWIMNKYTFFDKCRLPKGSIPTFPYGNFKDVVSQRIPLHEFLLKYYNRFKRKGYKYAGLFLFTKPVILLVNPTIISKVLSDEKSFQTIFPKHSTLENKKLVRIFNAYSLNKFLEKYNYFVKGIFTDSLKNDEVYSSLRVFFLETTSVAFGIKSCEMVEEINNLLNSTCLASFRTYFSLCYSYFTKSNNRLHKDLKGIFMETMEERKKNDLNKEDIVQLFIDFYNESNSSIDDITDDIFRVFADTLTSAYSTTMFCLYELAMNIDIQDDVIGEIRRFNKKYQSIDYVNLQELKYLDAVIKETLRKYPPIPTVIKKCEQGYKNEQLAINLPKDVLVFISIIGIHRDPLNYTKADAFDPDRFIEEGKFIKSNTFMPFGFGSDGTQIGIQFATLQIKLALICIFSSLKVSFKENCSGSIKFDPKFLSLQPCENFALEFKLL